ncbi:polysaccharide lyase, partial [Pontibacter korlensis]|uniref:polysaccharide lyase n=1 Tax=Pontibacter korlensis TaxID=400092 RepID=UPI00061B1022
MFNETFEGSSVFDGARLQSGASHAFQVVGTPVFSGSKSGRFELRDSDPEASNGTRAEYLFPENSVGKERWYSFRAYYPSSGYKTDSNNDILNQWHQGSGTGSPSSTFRVRNDRFLMRIGNTTESRKEYDLGVQAKDTWHEFVFHFVHSNGSDGLVEVWHNGEKVLTVKGGNMYDAPLPRWKVGIYKDDWNGSETTDSKQRVFFLDDVRMGNEKATLADMSSALVKSEELVEDKEIK